MATSEADPLVRHAAAAVAAAHRVSGVIATVAVLLVVWLLCVAL